MKNRLLPAVLFVGLSGCAVMPTVPAAFQPISQFDEQEVAWSAGQGTNSIKGNAVLRTRGGDVKTCAGFTAALSPVSTYTSERMAHLYGGTDRGYNDVRQIVPAPDALLRFIRTTVCDSQGNFVFDKLPDGEYFVNVQVTWQAPSTYGLSNQGGNLMQKVRVAGGEARSIVLTSE
ncbi:MAG: hypothetical protein K2Y27_09350 [Xanthobacteraceae bacterium]|jgi:hypothetical protein|nr:hypothetical protein [Xanthobacteraceae bacterium]